MKSRVISSIGIDSVLWYGVYIPCMQAPMTIGRLAKLSQVGVETVRFYERKGLLVQPPKSLGSFRHYPSTDVQRIRFIKRSQELGFTLKETKELLDLKLRSQAKCSDVLKKTNKKLDEVNHKIADLEKIKSSLHRIASCCEEKNVLINDCPVLEHFMDDV